MLWNGENGFEVKEKDKMKWTVNLDKRTCSCRYWQLSGLSCAHAISAIYTSSKSLDDYIDPCYSISQYMKTYQFCLQPVEGEHSWPVSDMPRPDPPAYVKMPGRKKTKRTREVGEKPTCTKMSRVGIKMKCSLCQKILTTSENALTTSKQARRKMHTSRGMLIGRGNKVKLVLMTLCQV